MPNGLAASRELRSAGDQLSLQLSGPIQQRLGALRQFGRERNADQVWWRPQALGRPTIVAKN